MKNFVLITNEFKDNDLVLSKKIIDYIKKKGGKAIGLISGVEAKNSKQFKVEDIPNDTDCILVLGGDGTLIRAATKLSSLEIPLIGINLGTLGYLCELEESTVFSAIDLLFEGNYYIEDRMALVCDNKNVPNNLIALNDVVVHQMGGLSILSFEVYVNGEFLSTYNADGIIIATPTGSTGYSMSAGGPIVDPKANMIVLTPINAHNLNSKSIVIGDDSKVEIKLCKRCVQKDDRAQVSFDGDFVKELHSGESFTVTKAMSKIKICKLNRKSFLEILRKKMATFN
ncbi:NAD(+)/NADH kinase [Lachnobacterium bovis]|uniref:NAD kinase n=1 Tax=Lachnobacterium bovis TaxID=140626 RepID=A0A1H9PU51_9FIRM|nr:NAD(+)/NADH kinase [Lachnobacterium bovis]SER51734.1 NAD+ kinase [Lachnobacterium bovis]